VADQSDTGKTPPTASATINALWAPPTLLYYLPARPNMAQFLITLADGRSRIQHKRNPGSDPMKRVVGIIQPSKLEEVENALRKLGISAFLA
jgi:hypothetical protein